MTLVIALALLIAFTWFISRRDEAGDPRWVALTGPQAQRVTVPRNGDRRS